MTAKKPSISKDSKNPQNAKQISPKNHGGDTNYNNQDYAARLRYQNEDNTYGAGKPQTKRGDETK